MRKWIKLSKIDCKEFLWKYTNYCNLDYLVFSDQGFWRVTFKSKKHNYDVYYHWTSWDIWYNPFSNSFRLYLNLKTKHTTLNRIYFEKLKINNKFFNIYTIDRIVLNKKIKIKTTDIFKYE